MFYNNKGDSTVLSQTRMSEDRVSEQEKNVDGDCIWIGKKWVEESRMAESKQGTRGKNFKE